MTGFKFLRPQSLAVKSCAGLRFETGVFSQVGTRQLTSLLLSTDGKYSLRSRSLFLGKYYSYVKDRDCKLIFLEVR